MDIKMKFGNASWGFRQMPLEEQLKITRGMGFSLLELGIANAPGDLAENPGEEEILLVKQLFGRYQVKLLYGATGTDFIENGERDVEKLAHVTETCAKLGIKYLRIFSSFMPVEKVDQERWEGMIDCLKEAENHARKLGVYLAVETHGGVECYEDGVRHYMSVSTYPEALKKMLKELPDRVKVNFDPANLWAAGIRHPEEIYRLCQERVAIVHLKDFVQLPTGHLRPSACGEGTMDWKRIMESLSDYKGAALIEYENPEDVAEKSAESYRYIRSLLKNESKNALEEQ